MGERICSVDGCEKPHKARGWCKSHYRRWLRAGTPEMEQKPHLFIDDLHDRVRAIGWDVAENGCWTWRGYLSNGYPFTYRRGKNYLVTKLVLEMAGQPSPFPGAVVRHRCDNPPCLRPDHLEWGTRPDNTQDMVERYRETSYRADHWNGMCRKGLHDISLPGGLIKMGERTYCAECHYARQAESNRRRRERRAERNSK